MAGVPNSSVKFNAREQLLSADLNRVQWLASRDAQDLEAARGRSFDSGAATPTTPSDLLGTLGAPISGLDKPPTFTFSSGYTVTIGDGRGFLQDATFVGLGADDSSYLVMRWDQADVTFANPHATLPRIDVVVATAGAADVDSQSRFILVDPVSRAISPQNVFKTSNPAAVLSVVTGSAGANPVVPSIPAHAIPLFYVWVVQSAPTAATFGTCRASWRRAGYPLAAMHGVLSGLGVKWDQSTDPLSADAPCIVKGFHRVAIDGEVMEFFANHDSTVGGFTVDSANNPFGSAAPATWHRPYYMYAVGGRHNPKPSFNTADGFLSPVTIVESLTAPNVSTGKPSANMTVGGDTITPNGAVYIGLGFTYVNTTHRHACFMDADMTYVVPGQQNVITHTWAASANEAIGTIASIPAISTKMKIGADIASTTNKLQIGIAPDRGDGGGPAARQGGSFAAMTVLTTSDGGTPWHGLGMGDVPCFNGNGKLWATNDITGTATVWAVAFNHLVGRVGVSVNP